MQSVKVLPKGQITLPKKIRKSLDIKEGDTLIVEKTDGEIVLKKGKTIFDYIGALPDLGISIEDMREKAIEEVAKERA
ncbi:MAG: AbrB/MazE/SpoVT family DNA-binding domain-containing protein [Nitrospirae bacterium]|nr:AbrB/MazE/SpoVT family DNA-binding domain-containing protein [Nitrospirota bacterium]